MFDKNIKGPTIRCIACGFEIEVDNYEAHLKECIYNNINPEEDKSILIAYIQKHEGYDVSSIITKLDKILDKKGIFELLSQIDWRNHYDERFNSYPPPNPLGVLALYVVKEIKNGVDVESICWSLLTDLEYEIKQYHSEWYLNDFPTLYTAALLSFFNKIVREECGKFIPKIKKELDILISRNKDVIVACRNFYGKEFPTDKLTQ